jgi:transposase
MKNQIPQIIIGIDLGDTKHRYHVLDQAGNEVQRGSIPNNGAALSQLARKYPDARVAIEVGTHSPWISRHLTAEGCEVFVANARKLRAIYENERKCDELDAKMLAKIARLDPELLHPVTHISAQAMTDRLALSGREQLVEARKRLIQSVRSLVKSLGHRIESCSSNRFPKAAREALGAEEGVMRAIEPMLTAIESIGASIRQLDEEIDRLGAESYPEARQLQQIVGVGPITALAFVLAVEDPRRLEKTRDIGAYLGIVPRRDQSGATDKSLGITKAGNAYVRRLLVQCAQYILGAHGPDCELRRFGLKLASRGGKAHKKKAMVAVARKLAVLMLSLWKSGEDYRPERDSEGRASETTPDLAAAA